MISIDSDDTISARGGSDRYTPRNDRRRYARDGVIDGSYGFDERMDTDDNYNGGGRLYSDNLVGGRRRERELERGRELERDQRRGNDRG